MLDERFSLVFLLASLIALPGCPAAAEGHELCLAAGVEEECGIAPVPCLESLREDDSFEEDHGYTDWRLSLDEEGRCILDVRHMGTVIGGLGAQGRVAFNLGVAERPGSLIEE